MNDSCGGYPCARHRVWCARQNVSRSVSVHDEQNGSPQAFRPVGSAAGTLAAHAAGSGCPLEAKTLRWRMHSPRPLLP